MKGLIFFVSCLFPFFMNAQLDESIRKLLDDRSSVYVDSTIIYTIDTNKKNRALQPHGVWRIRNNKDKTLLSITSNFDGRLHGHVLGFYPNGKIASSVYYSFDVLNGPSVSFWQNGNPQIVKYYKDGILDGIMKNFDSSGHLRRVSEIRQGKRKGIEIQLYQSGNIQYITQYVADQESGLKKEFKDNDKSEIIAEYEMKNGVRIMGRFYEGGILIRTESYNYEEELQRKNLLDKAARDGG